MQTPRFSIIAHFQEHASFFGETTQSLSEQCFVDWEAVFVDDGSLDGCGGIADEAARRDARIRVIHQRKAGTGPARNRALERVRGEYVAFVGPIDALWPDYLTIADALISQNANPGLVVFERRIFEKDEVWRTLPSPQTPSLANSEMVKGGGVVMMRFQATREFGGVVIDRVWRSDVVRRVRFYPRPGDSCDDGFFILCALPWLDSVMLTDYHGYCYRRRPSAYWVKSKDELIQLQLRGIRCQLWLMRTLKGDFRQPILPLCALEGRKVAVRVLQVFGLAWPGKSLVQTYLARQAAGKRGGAWWATSLYVALLRFRYLRLSFKLWRRTHRRLPGQKTR